MKVKRYFIALGIVLGIDLVWLLVLMTGFYDTQLIGFARTNVIWSALLAWALIPLGIVVFVDKIAKSKKEYAIYGGVYGLILYGMYEFTNYAILANWTLPMVIVDVIWGTFLCSVSSVLLSMVKK